MLIIAWTATKGPVVVWGADDVDMVKREQDECCQSIMLKSVRHVMREGERYPVKQLSGANGTFSC